MMIMLDFNHKWFLKVHHLLHKFTSCKELLMRSFYHESSESYYPIHVCHNLVLGYSDIILYEMLTFLFLVPADPDRAEESHVVATSGCRRSCPDELPRIPR